MQKTKTKTHTILKTVEKRAKWNKTKKTILPGELKLICLILIVTVKEIVF